MVNLTRIYTRTGDDGSTSLVDMSRTSKLDLRLVAYGTVDEANAAIGVAIATGGLATDVVETLTRVQNDLFDVGADLGNPVERRGDERGTSEEPSATDNTAPGRGPLRVTQVYLDWLEGRIDEFNGRLDKLRSFVLPGGTPGAATLHVARTVVRRAEREAWAAMEVHGDTMNPLTARYLNRVSDLLFVLSRVANLGPDGEQHDPLWTPGSDRY